MVSLALRPVLPQEIQQYRISASNGVGTIWSYRTGPARDISIGVDLRAAMRWAAAAAALAATVRGAVPSLPVAADVERLLARHVTAGG